MTDLFFTIATDSKETEIEKAVKKELLAKSWEGYKLKDYFCFLPKGIEGFSPGPRYEYILIPIWQFPGPAGDELKRLNEIVDTAANAIIKREFCQEITGDCAYQINSYSVDRKDYSKYNAKITKLNPSSGGEKCTYRVDIEPKSKVDDIISSEQKSKADDISSSEQKSKADDISSSEQKSKMPINTNTLTDQEWAETVNAYRIKYKEQKKKTWLTAFGLAIATTAVGVVSFLAFTKRKQSK